MILKIIAFLFLFLMSFSAFSDTYTAFVQYRNTKNNLLYSSASAACSGWTSSGSLFYTYSAPASCNAFWVSDSSAYLSGNFIATYVPLCPGGGTLSGSGTSYSCINAPVCASPSSYNSSGICSAPPVVCTAGQTKTLLIVSGTYPAPGTPPTFTLNHNRTATQEQPTTVSQGGCVYNLPLNPNQNTGCSTSPSGIMYCRVQATQTGANLSGSDTALDSSSTTNQTPVPSSAPGCVTTATGNTICASTDAKNCGTVNGANVCMADAAMQSNGYPASMVNGVVVADTTNVNGQVTNCIVTAEGKTVCVNPPTSSACSGGSSIFTCLQPEPTTAFPNPLKVPISDAVQTVSKIAKVTNADSTATETITTTNNIEGATPSVTTNQYSSGGALTSTSSVPGNSTGIGEKAQPGNALNSNVFKSTGNGTAPVDSNASGLATQKASLQGLMTNIKSQFTSLMPSVAGGGSISCDAGITIMGGVHFGICLADYSSAFSTMGTGLYAISAISALFIIFG